MQPQPLCVVSVHCRRHLNSTAFTLAKEDLPADDSRMAQMVLALSAAVGSWLAYCLSWLWVAVPTV
jgi:hypothetical protein